MKKLNNKGVTLIELIVSFTLIAVASVYFYKTLDVVVTLYKTSSDETKRFVDKNYAIRIAEATIKKHIDDGKSCPDSFFVDYLADKYKNFECIGVNNIKVVFTESGTSFYYSKPIEYNYVNSGGNKKICHATYIGNNDEWQEEFDCESLNLQLTGKIPQKEGYRFVGWSTKENVTDKEYDAGQFIQNNFKTNFTLYAVWEDE